MSAPDTVPPLDPDVAYWLEMAEAAAYQDTYAGAAAIAGDPCGARFAIIGGADVHALTALDFSFFNRTVGLGTARPATREDVAAVSAFYRDLGLGQSVIHVAPGAEPAELVDWVGEEGYTPGRRWVKVWHDLREIAEPSPALRIEVLDAEGADTFAEVCATAFEMPPIVAPLVAATLGRPGWTHYLGYEGATPVSAAAMYVTEGISWLGYGSTLEASRGRGWQTAMFLRRLRDARAAGCRMTITETGEETEDDPVNHSYRNMLRTGFRLAYARRNYVRVPSAAG
ncbi:MAG TPA: hypothetical protein VIK13_06665 [Candidatus Limnocylindrales bacterium]